ncbi:MAG: flavin reductase family protein [Thermotogota bacterium]
MDKGVFLSKVEYMMKKLIDGQVILTAVDEKRDATGMTIAWGFFGNMWNEPFFIAAVRPYRYTLNAIHDSGMFSVNFFDAGYQEALNYFGSVSGYDENKFNKGLIQYSKTKDCFAIINEARIVLNCRIITTNQIEAFNLNNTYIRKHYQQDNGYHVMIYGRIDEMIIRDHLKV